MIHLEYVLTMNAANIIIKYLCVAIFPLFVSTRRSFLSKHLIWNKIAIIFHQKTHANTNLRDVLDEMAAGNKTINGIFELAKTNGYLGSGHGGIIYRGWIQL